MSTTDQVTRGYIECMWWTALNVRNEYADEPGAADVLNACHATTDDPQVFGTRDNVPAEVLEEIERDVTAFLAEHGDDIAIAIEYGVYPSDDYAGHDLYLTRNGHGAGFWDRDYSDGPAREALMRMDEHARALGEAHTVELFGIDDDGEPVYTIDGHSGHELI